MPTIQNISAYKFIALQKIKTLQVLLKAKCESLELLGTILLGSEGMNLNLAGSEAAIQQVINYIHDMPEFSGMVFKSSYSDTVPFEKLVVRIKDEIVTMRDPSVHPEQTPGQHVSPEVFKQWLDEGRDMLVLDTRNQFEIEFGTFDQAKALPIDHFSAFPEAVSQLSDEVKAKPVVTFCTGGIRCEKAVLAMANSGFKEVYQLQDGILNYFEKCGGAHFQGECFVFDERVGVDAELKPTGTKQCKNCFGPVTFAEQQLETYIEGVSCPRCVNPLSDRQDKGELKWDSQN